MKPVKLRDLRRIDLPAFAEGEPAHVTSLRKTLEFHANYPDSSQVSVPQIMLDMIPPKPAEPQQLEQSAINPEPPSASPNLVNSAVTAAAAPLAASAAVIQPQTVAEPKAKKPRPETAAEAEPIEASNATE